MHTSSIPPTVRRFGNHTRLAALLCGLATAAAALGAEGWRAGGARISITPEGELWMTGYGFRDKPTGAKLQDLWAKAIALEDASKQRCILVTADLCGMTAEISNAVAARLTRSTGIPRAGISFNVSHTHCGPYIEGYAPAVGDVPAKDRPSITAYRRQLEERLYRVAMDAFAGLQPASLRWTHGQVDFAVNRRNNPEAEVVARRAAATLVGPVDHQVPVLAVRDANGGLKAVVFGYACHNTVLRENAWNGDYAGFAQAALEERHQGAVAMFVAGCGGDINPLPRRKIPLAQRYGGQLADAVDQVLDSGRLQSVHPTLKTAYRTVPLAFDRVPTREELTAELKQEAPRYLERLRAQHLLQRLAAGPIPGSHDFPVQAWRLGAELTFIALGGEPVVDYALRLKKELGPATWVAGYSNDVMAYIPSERVRREGGYEGATSMVPYAQPSPWAAGIEDKLITAVHGLLRDL